MDRGQKPFIKAWGRQSNPRWSPDGSKIAFVSDRGNHSFIAVYDVQIAVGELPGAGRRLRRRAGLVAGRQAGRVHPSSRDAVRRAGAGRAGRHRQSTGAGWRRCRGTECLPAGLWRTRSGRAAGSALAPTTTPSRPLIPGLCRATFAGGHTLAVMVADVAKGTARELWHNAPNDSTVPVIARLMWGSDRIVFPVSPLNDEWERYYSLDANASSAKPVLLTTTNGLIEDATSAALSADGKTLYYCTNASDIERRHIWAVPAAGGTPKRISTGEGIETYPQPLASGKQVAVLYFDVSTPASVGLVPVDGGQARVIFPTLAKRLPEGRAREARDRGGEGAGWHRGRTTSSSCRRTSSPASAVPRSSSCTAARRGR